MTRYLGKETTRVDGVAKVTGQAKYAAEFQVPHLAYGFLVLSSVARGRVLEIDTAEAERAAGVIRVFTHSNTPVFGPGSEMGSPTRNWALQSDRILFNGQPIALVVAESYEQARYAARLVQARYQAEPHITDLNAVLDQAQPDSDSAKSHPRGNPQAALESAAVRLSAEYRIPVEHHNPIEPHAAIAVWEGEQLTLFDKTQQVNGVRQHLASSLGVSPERIRVISPFVGGAFGASLKPNYYPLLTAMAARELKRPVKLVYASV